MARRRWNLETIEQVLDGENPFKQFGYTGKKYEPKRKIGEEWTDKIGKKWRKTETGKTRVNKLDSIRESLKQKCSVCGTRIDFSCNKLDHKTFPKTGKCYDCLESEEMVIRISGKWDEYEKLKLLKNRRGALNDFKDKLNESIEYLKNDTGKISEVTSSGGDIISFTGKCNSQWLIDAENDLVKTTGEIKKVTEEIETIEKIFYGK